MRPVVHEAMLNLVSTLTPDDDVEEVIRELREEHLSRNDYDVTKLRDAFIEVSRRHWEEQNLPDCQRHSIGVRHLRSIT